MTLWRSWTKIFLTIVLPIAYSKVNHEWDKPATITYKECTNNACKKEAENIIACMNPHADPCKDFYEYACGNWPKTYMDPDKLYRGFPWRIENLLEYKAFSDIRTKLEEPVSQLEDENNKKAKNLYKFCMNLPWMSKLKAADLRTYIARAGPWPMFPVEITDNKSYLNWLPVHNYYLRLTSESGLFGIVVKFSSLDKKTPTLEIRKALSPYGLFSRSLPWTEKELSGYLKFLKTIANDVKPSNRIAIPTDDLHKYFEDVMNFRIKLQNIIKVLEKETQQLMSIEYLNHWYNQKEAARSKTAQIQWLPIIRTLYKNEKNTKIDDKTVVFVGYATYFERLRALLAKTPSETIVNHIHLYFIERHLRFNREEEDLNYAWRNYVAVQPMIKARVYADKWYACIEKHVMQNTLGKMYVDKHSSRTLVKHVQVLLEDVKEMVGVQVNDSAWLDSETKSATTYKIAKMKSMLGYPPWYDNRSKKKKYAHIDMIPHHPEAKYMVNENRIIISSAYMQTPIYDVSLPFNLNYASMGAIIGHEIYHAIDNKGVCFDVEGKQTKWWVDHMIDIYRHKKQCYIKQYSHYEVKELQGYTDAPKKYSFETVEEDISDTMGLKAAYEAYKLKLLKENYICSTLPNLSRYTCDELFFISFARSFCFAITTPRQLMYSIRYDDHSTSRNRVNGAVSNMKEFSDAFRCNANALLNPRKKCDLWE